MIRQTVYRDDYNPDYKCESDVSIVDQSPNQNFNINEFGYIRNDITALVRSSTEQEYNAIASRLQVMETEDENKGLSVNEMLQRIRPRWIGDPVEVEKFADYLAALDNVKYGKHDSKVEEKPADDKVVEQSVDDAPDGL